MFESGVHGKTDFVSSMASEFDYTPDKDGSKNESSFKRYIRLLFSKVDTMSNTYNYVTYNYVKKHKELYPEAWRHHLARGGNKDYSLKEKIKFTTETVSV